MIEVDFTRTHEVIEMLDVIRDGVEPGCKDRCYIKGSGAESVRWVLELARDYLAAYARGNNDHGIREVIDMMKTKLKEDTNA